MGALALQDSQAAHVTQQVPMNEYTAVIKQDGDWWIGWIEEVPGVNCQEPTYEELLETLRVTLEEILTLNDIEGH